MLEEQGPVLLNVIAEVGRWGDLQQIKAYSTTEVF